MFALYLCGIFAICRYFICSYTTYSTYFDRDCNRAFFPDQLMKLEASILQPCVRLRGTVVETCLLSIVVMISRGMVSGSAFADNI